MTTFKLTDDTPVQDLIDMYWEAGYHDNLTPSEGGYLIQHMDAWKDGSFKDLADKAKSLAKFMVASRTKIDYDALHRHFPE